MKRHIINQPGTDGGLTKYDGFGSMIREVSDALDMMNNFAKSCGVGVSPITLAHRKSNSFPKIDVRQTDEEYIVDIVAAGYSKENISLELKDNILYIELARSVDDEIDFSQYIFKEISYRAFSRAVTFSERVMPEDIKCKFENGIVTCVLKKFQLDRIEDDTTKITIE